MGIDKGYSREVVPFTLYIPQPKIMLFHQFFYIFVS